MDESKVEISLKSQSGSIELQYDTLPDKKVIEKEVELLELIVNGDVESEKIQPVIYTLKNLMNIEPNNPPEPSRASFASQALVNARKRTMEYMEKAASSNSVPLRIDMWKIGKKLVFVFVGAEIFAETGFFIKSMSKELEVIPIGYSSPLIGYLPLEGDCKFGGYEVEDAWRFYCHPAPFSPQSESRVRQQTLKQFEQLISANDI